MLLPDGRMKLRDGWISDDINGIEMAGLLCHKKQMR